MKEKKGLTMDITQGKSGKRLVNLVASEDEAFRRHQQLAEMMDATSHLPEEENRPCVIW